MKPVACNDGAEDDGAVVRLVSLRLDRQMIGLPIEQVRDVFQFQEVAPVPLADAAVCGLVNLRGRVVLLLSLAGLIGLGPGRQPPRLAVSLLWRGEVTAIAIDEIGDVLALSAGASLPVPGHLAGPWARAARRVHRLDDELLIELDLQTLMDLPPAQAA